MPMDSHSLASLTTSPFKAATFATFPKPRTPQNHSFPSPSKYKKPKSVAVTVNSRWDPPKPFSYLFPVFQKVRDFAANPSNKNPFSSRETECMLNGAFGTALMSVTATAKVKISPFVSTLAANPAFVSGLCALAFAQSMKVFLNFCVERKWDFKLMCASGGMPSSHSALCTALTTSVAICHGVADSLFPVCLGFSLIVMYDAIGVRRHAGMQAQVLNLIVEDLFQGHPISQRKLKELLGHTPSQVFAGALLGILVAWKCCSFPV